MIQVLYNSFEERPQQVNMILIIILILSQDNSHVYDGSNNNLNDGYSSSDGNLNIDIIDNNNDWEKMGRSQCDDNNIDNNKLDQLDKTFNDIEWNNNSESINNPNKIDNIINITGYNKLDMTNQQNFINNINKLITIENHNNTNKSKTFIKRINNLITYENSNNYRKHPNNDSNTIITELMLSPIPQNTFTIIKKRTYKIVNKQ
ncbi:hypothetical protein ACTA71_000645 [Dictyostelium dimigraforme]